MSRNFKIILSTLLALGAIGVAILYMLNTDIAVLNPKGWIAYKERELLIQATLLMLIIVIPVFVIAFVFAWKYRADNTDAPHDPHWDRHTTIELVWWGFPFAIVVILSIITYKGCHELDPFKPLVSDVKPIRIQAVALDWKWLFIYPEQKIATVNFVQFPEKTPLNFEITADAPMNALWIPHLGGQVYAMAGMRTKLHLIADEPGSYRGSSANLSGKGFSGMWFTATSCTEGDFDAWVESVRQSGSQLDLAEYLLLAEPSERNPVTYYQLQKEDLFDWIIMKYMMPMQQNDGAVQPPVAPHVDHGLQH